MRIPVDIKGAENAPPPQYSGPYSNPLLFLESELEFKMSGILFNKERFALCAVQDRERSK